MEASNPPVALPPVVRAAARAGSRRDRIRCGQGRFARENCQEKWRELKAIKAANPGVEPTKLKVGQKLDLPAGGTAPGGSAAASAAFETGTGGEAYTVKSGDTLTKIAKAHGTTVKAIEAENNLTTTTSKSGRS